MKLKLSTKALFWLIAVIIIAMASSVTALVYARQVRYTLDDSILKDAREMFNAAELDIALLKQRNSMTFHLLSDDDSKWMAEVDNLEPISRNSYLLSLQGSPGSPQDQAMLVADN